MENIKTTEDKIIICNIFKIEIFPKEINNFEAIIVINNNEKSINGTNIYNYKTKNELYKLFYKIEELYLKYFEKIIENYSINDIEKKIVDYIKN